MRIDKVKGHLAMIFANVAWGLMSPFIKTIVLDSEINSWLIVAFRVLGATIAFWTVSVFMPREKISFKELGLIALAAIFGIMLNQGVFVLGVSYTSPINASIVTTTLPIIAMIISAFYLKEPVTWKKLAGIIVGGAGAVIIILSSKNGAGSGAGSSLGIKGILLCFGAQVSYAIYFVFFKNFVSKHSPVTLMKWMFLFSSLIYLPLTWKPLTALDFHAIPVSVYSELAFVVFGATFFTYLMIPIGQKYLRPTVATMYNNVQPVIAAFAAVIMQIDHFGIGKAFAIVLVFFGVYLVTTSKSRERL